MKDYPSIITLTPQLEGRFKELFEKTWQCIDTFKADGDVVKFKKALCDIFDESPNFAYLEPETLENYGFEGYEENQWVEFDKIDDDIEKDAAKELIKGFEEFGQHQLCGGSGSLLITIFGDSFLKITQWR